jgi:hypothetical protein
MKGRHAGATVIRTRRILQDDQDIHVDIPIDQVKSERVIAFDNYWRSKSIHGRLPSRADIDPAEMRPFLPGLLLTDITQAPFRVYYRLCGTEVSRIRGELTGFHLDQWPHWTDEEKQALLADYRVAVTGRRPYFSWDRVRLQSGSWRYFYSGIWPLSTDGERVDKCIAFEDYVGIDPATVLRPERGNQEPR